MTHFDGHGGLSQVDFVVIAIHPCVGDAPQSRHDPITNSFNIDESGKYTVYPDCTGSAEIDMPPQRASGVVIKLMFRTKR